ncbi:NADP-dependent oxidoreductase domain-containing protein [Mycena haematopus]|nr:NADP-dependent oxidoreductase domain-containing protein [Mycena haematopus]
MPFGTFTLNDGRKIPAIAFGTGSIYKMVDVTQYVEQAIDVGFSHLDTAQYYETEEFVGTAIRESGLARSDLYVTTKSHGPGGEMHKNIENSLSKLGLEYVDLYLIHNPRFFRDIDAVWKEFEQIQKDGLAKSIGVSNFTLEPLQSLVRNALVVPAVNQIEFHPYNWAENKALVEWSTKQGIVTAGYSSLSSITHYPGGPVDAPVAAAAARLNISATQVLLSWARAKGVVIVTTTSNRGRLEEYLAVGDLPPLSDAEVVAIDEAGAKGPPSAWLSSTKVTLSRRHVWKVLVFVLLCGLMMHAMCTPRKLSL